MANSLDLGSFVGFDWDKGNINKNKEKHDVEYGECEEAFVNKPFILFTDPVHSQQEKRCGALGKTNKGRKLAIYFIIRSNKIRVISARDQGKRDRKTYLKVEQMQNV